ncbi:MAG: bacterio-opsin activator [Caldisericia bacterium]|jgi:probable regulatory domain-containing protein|nr:bacterio-opsin activator [Caldisericia bacterium]
MVIEVKGPEIEKDDIEILAGRVFFKCIDLLGGLNKLALYRTLTWLPSLARASFAIVLKEEYLKTEDEIAKHVGLTKNSVRNILRAKLDIPPQELEEFLEEQKEKGKDLKFHVAGSIAKLAYKLVKEGEESQILIEFSRKISQDAIYEFDIPWAYLVLKNTKGLKYPIKSQDDLVDKIGEIKLPNGKEIKDFLSNLKYPIKNPSELLHEIKEKMG